MGIRRPQKIKISLKFSNISVEIGNIRRKSYLFQAENARNIVAEIYFRIVRRIKVVNGIYSAADGMIAQLACQDVIANNLANSNTPGFKRDIPVIHSFSSQLSAAAANMTSFKNQTLTAPSNDPLLNSNYTDMTPANYKSTDNPTDIALDGSGCFCIKTQFGERYTRAGNFKLNAGGTLATQSGEEVIGTRGTIKITSTNWRIDNQGNIIENNNITNSLKLVDFNGKQIGHMGDNMFNASSSVQPANMKNLTVRQGYLEESNVNSVKEMVNMISIMRSYETSSKVIQMEDQTLDKAINDVGKT